VRAAAGPKQQISTTVNFIAGSRDCSSDDLRLVVAITCSILVMCTHL
jgi:hypothetical protein